MFSAYTIRKVLPRLLIAAIAIQLSWWLATELIKINNDVAHGIEGIMYAPFGGASKMTLNAIVGGTPGVNATQFSAATLFTGVAAGTAFFAAGASSLVGILALATTAALGAIIALFTLVLRQAVLVSLVLVTPVAIAAWVLPGTQKVWKIWWESFSKLLLMYPMIVLMIAGGRIFASVAASLPINQFAQFAMIILGFFGPLLLIPATLKLSGVAFASLTGAVNSKGKGAFDRLRNVRGNEAKKTWAGTKSGQRLKGSNAMTAGINRFGARVASGPSGRFGIGKGGKNYMDEFLMTNSDEFMKSQAWKGNMFKDDAMRALTYGNEATAKRELQKRVAAGKMDKAAMESALVAAKRIGYGSTSQVAAARQMAMNKTGFDDAQDAMETIYRATGADSNGQGGNQSLQTSLKENVKFISKGVGRHDLGALGKRGKSADGSVETDDQWNDRLTVAGAQTADAMTLARDHGNSVANIADSVKRIQGSGPKRGTKRDPASAEANARSAAGGLATAAGYATLQNSGDANELARMGTGGTTTAPASDGGQVVTTYLGPDGKPVLGPDGKPQLRMAPDRVTREETFRDVGQEMGGIDASRVADDLSRGAGPGAPGAGDHE